MEDKSLANIRNEYKKAALSEDKVAKDPIEQFNRWFAEAKEAAIVEPTAMTLATATKTGIPSTRIVLLKGIEKGNFLFFTNYQSSKGNELESNPHASLNFFWPSFERQINIKGIVERTSERTSTIYFQSRPKDSQIGAWSSPQSCVIDNRKILEKRKAEIEEKYAKEDVLPRPKQWGGYAVKPYYIEFWQGRAGRLHDRIIYVLDEKGWEVKRLAP